MRETIERVFSEGFRVFFLSAGLFAIATMAVWMVWLIDSSALDGLAMSATIWHAHEMVFGYASAAIAGFLLTAVPNWTGSKAAPINMVALAAALWALGRGAMAFSGHLPAGVVAAADLAFVPVLLVQILLQLLKRPKPQNMMFLVFLSLFWLGNLMMHLEWMGLIDDGEGTGLRVGLLVVCSMIAVLGGRVTPAFTRNAMRRAEVAEDRLPVSRAPVERASLILSLGLPITVLVGLPDVISGTFAVLLGLLQIIRISGWCAGWALRQPIIIALHLGLATLGVGLILWGAALLGFGSEISGLHMLGIGAVGGMTLAVMSRATLGHSGRALIAPKPVAIAYGLLPLAAILRWVGESSTGALHAAATLWLVAFILYAISLWSALTGPRQAK